jgi:DNA mismatch repair protein MutS
MEEKDFDTPVIKQWRKIKASHSEDILFYRLGDFYELFYEDAKICSRVLNIQLTKRKNKNQNVPMAGVPYHSANGYISKLLQFGYSVVLCEQVGEAKESKGLMERRVERILTPATVFEEEYLDDNADSILASLFFDFKTKKVSISLLDITTNKFQCLEVEQSNLINELKNINPKEIILNSKFKEVEELKSFKNLKFLTWDVELSECYHYLLNHFEVSNLYSYKIENSNNIIRASYNALVYTQNTTNNSFKYIKNIEKIEENNFLYIDSNSKNNLDLIQKNNSVYSLLNSCSTSMGSRKFFNWINKPLNNKNEIILRQNAVTSLLKTNNLSEILKDFGDIERIISRIQLKSVKPKELTALKKFLTKLPLIKNILINYEDEKINILNDNIIELRNIRDLIEESINEEAPMLIKDGNVIKEKYDIDLDDLRNINNSIGLKIIKIEENEKNKHGFEKIKISYNKIIGYFIEIPTKNLNKIPENFIRKQTLKNVERFYTKELKLIEDEVFSAKAKSLLKEKELYSEILDIINQNYDDLKKTVNAISELDVLCNLSNKAKELNLVKPTFEDKVVNIINGRHILVENNQDSFQSNSLIMNKEKNVFIITGANMGGKSTYMRQNALIIVLAQIGSYVPAECCNINVFDKLFTRIGASDNISEGLSTFMVEMTETANILNNANDNSFILLDEIGRGTSTYEGVSIAWSVAKKISKKLGAYCLFATHYFELTELEQSFENITNIFLESSINDSGKLVFSHQVKEGSVNNSYGIEVCKLAGVPNDVVLDSRLKLKSLENNEINTNDGEVVLDYLNNIDIDSLSPKEALNILYKINEIKKSS